MKESTFIGTVFGLALWCVVLIVAAFARIGETPKECQQRYGAGVKTKTGYVVYQKSGYSVAAQYHEGRCDNIGFRRQEQDVLDRPLELTDTEIDALLAANGKGWQRVGSNPFVRAWRGEGGLAATYDATERILSIVTAEYLERQKAEQLGNEKTKLKEF